MTNSKKEEILKEYIEKFVIDKLQDRYKDHVSNSFLTYLLFYNMRHSCIYYTPEDTIENIAYNVAVSIFENNLEYNCSCIGNGHHVSQSFASWMKEFKIVEE